VGGGAKVSFTALEIIVGYNKAQGMTLLNNARQLNKRPPTK
jgi:hypothetical protein